ncbi:MAG: TetR/AcrR family transcriptional regulator [Microbacterium sp.]
MSTSISRTAYHHGDLRNALLDSAASVAHDVGAEALSLREVARRAGVSHTAAYNHFADKNDLLRGLAIRAFDGLAEELEKAAGSTAASLEDMSVAYLRFAWENAAVFRFMFQRSLCMPEGVFDPLQEAGLASQNVLRSGVVRLQENGVLRSGDPDQLTLALWSQVHGITTILLETPVFKSATPQLAEELVRQGVRALCEGIRHPV